MTAFMLTIGRTQHVETYEEAYLFFDELTGIENSDVHYGVVYQELHPTKNKKTKFYPHPDFEIGSIVFNGQPYFNLSLKYNVYEDQLLLEVENRLGGDILQLDKASVNSFNIGNHRFINLNASGIEEGYYEILELYTSGALFQKHKKSIRQLLGERRVFYEFEEAEPELILQCETNYYAIEKPQNLFSIFPDHSDSLRSFYDEIERGLTFDEKMRMVIGALDRLVKVNSNEKQGQ